MYACAMCLFARSTVTAKLHEDYSQICIYLCHYILDVEPTFMKAQICTNYLDIHAQNIKIYASMYVVL